MAPVLVLLGVALLVAVLTSILAARSPLSSSAVFLVAGILGGPLVLDVIELDHHAVELLAEVALFAILFTDGQHAPLGAVRDRWRGPTLTLLVAMPLTFGIVTVLTHVLTGLPWAASAVVGAVLAPTDPVFASALVGREDVPRRVRNLLNVESGLNDGLALPAVLVLVGTAGGDPDGWSTEPTVLLVEAVVGCALGVAVPVAIWLVLRIPGVGSEPALRPLGPVAVAVLLFGLTSMLQANQFLAAFLAGVTISTVAPTVSESFRHTGELVTELVKGVALLGFATLLDWETWQVAGWMGLLLAAAVLLLSRPVPVLGVLYGSGFTHRERLAVAWFGPKGFASVAYAVIVSASGMPGADAVLALTAVTVLLSVVAHSSTDVTVARWLGRDATRPA